jgi:hypothetical protein
MATITRYVNNGSAGGNGTTAELSGANAAYASLNAWEAAENTDLTDSGGDIMVVNCAGSTADTTATTIDGWSTNSTCWIEIIGDWTPPATGDWYDTTKYHFTMATTGAIANKEDYVKIRNVQIYSTRNSTFLSCAASNLGASNLVELDSCLFKGDNSTVAQEAITIGATCKVDIYNCIIYNIEKTTSSSKAIDIYAVATVKAYSNTIYGAYQAFRMNITNGHWALYNNICNNVVDAYSIGNGTLDGEDYNISNVAADFPNAGGHDVNSGTVTFVAAGDFHLDPTDTTAAELGWDSSGTAAPLNFTVDISDVTRPQSTNWDIGCSERAAEGGATTTNVVADLLSLTATLPTPVYKYDYKFTPSLISLTSALKAPTVIYTCVVSPSVLTLTSTLKSPTVNYDYTLTPSLLSLTANILSPAVQFDYLLGVSALALTATLLDPTTQAGITVTPDVLALTATLIDPTVSFDYLLALASLDLTAALKTTTVNFDFAIDLTALALSAGILDPTVTTTTGRCYFVYNSANTSIDFYVGGTLVTRLNASGDLDVKGVMNTGVAF